MCKVVKIRAKLLFISIVMLVFLMNIAHAAGSKLVISDVDVKIGSKTLKNLTDGQTISEEARPGRTVEVRVEARNAFTRAEDVKIQDVTIKVTIENIDNGDDLEQESTNFDLRADSEAKFNFKFDVPLEVREDTYNVVITAEGNDDSGTRNFAEVKLKLEVNKENHRVIILEKSLTPDEASCQRKNIHLSTTLLNIGNDDEDKVKFQILNSQLGVNIENIFGSLRALPNEPESRFSKVYSFDVPVNADPGSYPLTLRATYDNDRKVTEDSVTLVVSNCVKPLPETIIKGKEESLVGPDESEVQLILPTIKPTTPPAQPTTPAGAVVTLESPLRSTVFIAGIIAVAVIAVLIAVALFFGWFRNRS